MFCSIINAIIYGKIAEAGLGQIRLPNLDFSRNFGVEPFWHKSQQCFNEMCIDFLIKN